jgi:hypothetical protein
MAEPTSANYVFLPWVRQGAASGIQTPDSLGANQAGIVSVPVKLRINNTDDIDRQVRLYGPGDVTGIDPQQVVRTDPRHQATDFEPNYFPAIEFDRPDFPWLFTPAQANADGKLRPWLCLVVVRKQDGVTLRTGPLLPVLEIDSARAEHELPDLTDSWAWVHAQVAGVQRNADSLKQSLAGDSALTVSRLLCPRRLDPLTEYLACVVPAFEPGRKAGLGLQVQPEDENELKPAWMVAQQSPVTLPIYFHWEFRTGTGGDFEALVESLEARDSRDLPTEVGKRQMDVGQPGFSTTPPLPSETVLDLKGALCRLEATTTEWSEEIRTLFQGELKKILDAPAQAISEEGADPLLAPPIYGCWQAARQTVDMTPAPPASVTWLDELNLDPRHRAIAALGTAVVQTQQEPLMASAWEQLGEIERINQMQRLAQLGRAVNAVYHSRHFRQFSEETLLKVIGSAQSRVVIDSSSDNTRMLLSQRIAQSTIPARAISAPLRRLTSPRGVISSRFRNDSAAPIAIVAKLNTTSIVPLEKKEAGLVTLNQVSDNQSGTFAGQIKQTVRFENATNALETTPPLSDFKIVPEDAPLRTLLDFTPGLPANSADAQAFRNVAKEHQAYLEKTFMSTATSTALVRMNLLATKAQLLQSVDPEKTISARVQASLIIAGGTESRADPLEPILDAPDFPQPMYEALRDLSQDFLFPGLEKVPANTVTLLETNPKFVESFLVGLNAEMSRELLWRNYPTDQRGTYFRQFWDTSAGSDQPDIDRINQWPDRKLGENAGAGEQLVLLIRGELLRRYPNSVIYAVAAKREQDQLELSAPAVESHPIFRGTLKPDVTFLGFALTEKEAIADPGWFFVIQEQPTEPRFGMDVANFAKPLPDLETWNDLSWRHLANTEAELKALSHASTKTTLPDVVDKAKWGKNSAHQAYITLQRPVRIAIHAKEMIKQGST